MNKPKVMAAMSGGVDSSVAAYLLKKEGFEVAGLTMCLGIKREDSAACCGAEAINDAKKVCDRLDIPHYVLDFSQDLQTKVITPFIEDYLSGKTPNPCVNCNKYLKFDILLKKAMALGFGFLATGHYAAITQTPAGYFLKRSADKKKDQTYFLYAIKKEVLPYIKFPLADLTKPAVRVWAKEAGLPVAEKKESQDICFVPDNDYARLIGNSRSIEPGDIVDLKGKILGRHKGIIYYTIGQRQGLGIGGGTPFYVTAIDVKNNQIVVGGKNDLLSRGLIAVDTNMFLNTLPAKLSCKIRYASKEVPCSVTVKGTMMEVIFHTPQEAVTPGQSVVLYDGDIVAGGGTIAQALE